MMNFSNDFPMVKFHSNKFECISNHSSRFCSFRQKNRSTLDCNQSSFTTDEHTFSTSIVETKNQSLWKIFRYHSNKYDDETINRNDYFVFRSETNGTCEKSGDYTTEISTTRSIMADWSLNILSNWSGSKMIWWNMENLFIFFF